MADFCKQCSTDIFGRDWGDLAGLCADGEVVGVLCEDCGSIWVNHLGECVTVDCFKSHGQADTIDTGAKDDAKAE